MPMPRLPEPDQSVPTLAHGDYRLIDDASPSFCLVVFYLGLHCPICLRYLLELARPNVDESVAAIDFATAHSYPARGEYGGPL